MLSSKLIHNAIKESVYSFSEVASYIGVSRPHLYKMFREDSLRLRDINLISILLGVDIQEWDEFTEFDKQNFEGEDTDEI